MPEPPQLAPFNAKEQRLHSDLFRPPYGRITAAQARLLSTRYKVIMWDILSFDYQTRMSAQKCLKNVTKHLQGGSIVVFHDSEKSFNNMSYAFPRTLEYIEQLGLKCRTL